VTVLSALMACALVGAGPTCELRGDLSGNALEIGAPGGPALVRIEPLFGLTFTDMTMIGPPDMSRRAVEGAPLSMEWDHPRATVVLNVEPQDDRVLFRAAVTCRQGAILHVAVPFSFTLAGEPVERLLWPDVMGVELSSQFLHSEKQLWMDYPPAFCDFAAAEVGGASAYFYRCETEKAVHPSVLAVLGGPRPTFRHFYAAYIREGETWRSPAVACQIGGDLRETLLRYKRECGLGRGLSDKLGPSLVKRWSGMAEAMLTPPFGRMALTAERMPLPAVVEPATWMFGGFDRKYPDFLPPNEAHGGEAGFRRFIDVAHGHGHLVRPYVNFTWWCTGWDGEDSRPAPSYEEYGSAPLSRDMKGELQLERYGANFGYRVTPSHPAAVRKRLEVRDALLDSYGVDILYCDQLGARNWLLDLNPALPNPADYGSALMATGAEDAARCPIETEFGHDQVLSFASAMNYWCLPPLAARPSWPGAPAPPDALDLVRPFPFGLFVSTGDAVVSIPDTRDPARLAWSLLLGGRVSLGWSVDERLAAGPERARIEFLQRLARALGEDVLTDRLVRFEYLAPRVCRSTFERHSVIANFSTGPWITGDGASVAPGGYDLRAASGLRAGHYAGVNGMPVSVFIEPGGAAWALAPRGFGVDLPGLRVTDPGPMPGATVIGRSCVVFDAGPGLGANYIGGLTGEDVREAFTELRPVRVSSPTALSNRLPATRVIVHANSEFLPCASLDNWAVTLAKLREWCEGGGILVEVASYPLWIAAAPDTQAPDGWAKRQIAFAGFEDLCADRCKLIEPPLAAETVRVTALGQNALSPAAVAALEGEPAVANRPLLDSAGALVIATAQSGDYITVRPLGHGAIVRVGGVPTRAALRALAETVTAILNGRLPLGPPAWRVPVCAAVVPEGPR